MSRTVKAHLLLILTTLVWGVTFVQVKDALRFASPLAFNAVRMSLAAAVLAALYGGRLRGLSRPGLVAGLRVGFFLFLGYAFQTTGLRLTTPSKSAFLTGVAVVLVPVFMSVFWRRRVRGWTWAGVLTAFAGLYLMTVPAAGSLAGVNTGDLLTLGCAVAFGLQIIFLGSATRQHRFEAMAVLQAVTAAALTVASVPLLEDPHLAWNGRVVAAILVTGLLGTAAAFTIQAWAQQFTSPTYTALIFALEPVFAWLASYALGERLGGRAVWGAGLILAGIVLAELKGSPTAAENSAPVDG